MDGGAMHECMEGWMCVQSTKSALNSARDGAR
jgi:hypothetical protein